MYWYQYYNTIATNHSSPPPPQQERDTQQRLHSWPTPRGSQNGFWALYGETSGARTHDNYGIIRVLWR